MNLELLKTFTVLYVEDEQNLQNDIYENISPFVKEIIRANDGVEGLGLYQKNRESINIVISDILMPNMNGIEMVDEIRKIDSDIPVIYTTAFNDSEYMKKTIEQSVISYIIKPIDVELLLNAIAKASVKVENERLKDSLKTINTELEKKVDNKTQELQIKNEELYRQLFTDELTNLPNRKALFRDKEDMHEPVLFLIDIDSFKNINDLYGEHIGNQVLKSAADLIKEFSLKKGYNYYRMGADEFAMMKDGQCLENEAIFLVEDILSKIHSHTILIDEYNIDLRIDATIGISKGKEDTHKNANMALKKAKKLKLPYLVYSEEHNQNTEHENDIKWTKIIEKALDEDNVISYYQPIVDKDKNVIKYESLMRIVDGKNIYSPFLFLDIAKKVRFYNRLEKSVLNKAFLKAKQSATGISINVSFEDIVNVDFIKFVEEKLLSYDIAHLVTFEILEGENITNYEKVISFIDRVRKLGCSIAIDDFGSGYSNFVYLLKIKPDLIKIDGSLIKNIHIDENAFLIVKTINDFAHNLGMKTVAEFVHCEEVFELLKDIGVDKFQGYYISEPLSDF